MKLQLGSNLTPGRVISVVNTLNLRHFHRLGASNTVGNTDARKLNQVSKIEPIRSFASLDVVFLSCKRKNVVGNFHPESIINPF